MKNTTLFKSLIDILYFIHILALLVVPFILRFGTVNINQANVEVENLSILHWSFLIISLFTDIIFLRGLYYLRKVAKFILSKKYFTNPIVINLKKSGIHFVLSGIIYFLLLLSSWISKLYIGKLEITFDSNIMIPLFLTIIGLFFMIQSRTLILAKGFKDEIDLTV